MDNFKLLQRTPQEITNDILTRMNEVDTRPSSVNFQSASAISQELRNNALMVQWASRESFIGTATGENLDMLAEQFKFKRNPPIKAVVKAEIVSDDIVPNGNRFASTGLTDSLIYKVIEYSGNNIYYLECETLDPRANYYLGDLAIIDFVSNVTKAEITEITLPQKEEESDEEFRERIQSNLIAEATDGNVAQYKKWLSEIEGVGKSKVIPLWNGANTVKCIILNEINKKASEELVEKVQNILDPDSEGLGEGLAPIGAIVTVDTVEEMIINITIEVEFKEGRTSAPTLKEELNKFFSEIAFDRSVVSYLQIAGIIANNNDIDFIKSLTINEGREDIPIEGNNIPVLGELDVN